MIHCILLAAGLGTRFTGDKLNFPVGRKPMYRHILDHLLTLRSEGLCDVRVVTRPGALRNCPVPVILNPEAEEGIASSLRRGLSVLPDDSFPVAFFVADQPYLTLDTLRGFLSSFPESGILRTSCRGVPGNPVCFDRRFVPELMALRGDTGGKAVIAAHPDAVRLYEVSDPEELKDLDRNEGGDP